MTNVNARMREKQTMAVRWFPPDPAQSALTVILCREPDD